MKPFLVLLRAGPATDWPRARDRFASDLVDVAVAWNGTLAPVLPGAAFVHACEGPRWPALAKTLAAHAGVLGGRRQVWMPDDGVACTPEEAARLFAVCEHLVLDLAQPAFAHDGPAAHPLAWQHAGFQVRFTNFVDPAAPVFSLAMLARSLDLLAESEDDRASGLVWPKLTHLGRVAVIDALCLRRLPCAAPPDAAVAVRRFVDAETPVNLGGLLASGDALCLGDAPAAEDAFLLALDRASRPLPLGTAERLRYLSAHLAAPGSTARLPVREALERALAPAGLAFNLVLPAPPAVEADSGELQALRAERDRLAAQLAEIGRRLAPAARLGRALLAPEAQAA